MAIYGQIADGVIIGINKTRAKEVAPEWVPIPEGVGIGWIKDGETYVAPPEPEVPPRALSRIEFVRHCMDVGGMTSAMLVSAKADANLAALWIMLEMSNEVRKDAPEVPGGIAALDALGYLPNGAQAVLDGWPT